MGRPKLEKTNEEIEERNFRNKERNTIQRRHKRKTKNKHNLKLKKRKEMLGLYTSNEEIEYLDSGDLEKKCNFCGALTFVSEASRSKHSCCHQGKIVLPKSNSYPEEIKELIFGTGEINRHFRDNIRIYNNLFAFASFNAQNVDLKGNGPYSMRIVGEATVKATTSLETKSGEPHFGQIYIYDDGEAMFERSKRLKRTDVLEILQPIMNRNPYAEKFRNLYEIQSKNIDKEYHLSFYSLTKDHPRVYNNPTCQELAAIISSKKGTIEDKVDIRVYPRAETDSRILSFNSLHTDPLLFPLLFPNGETGWNYNLTQHNSNKRITASQYYGYKLAIRPDDLNQLLWSQRLTQHYIINCYLKIESNRLYYVRSNQSQLRSEHIQGLIDHIQNSSINNSDTFKVGKAVILPCTYRGSPRAMQQLYHDAMAISRNIGRPDLFITMTCNPKSPEIKRFLKDYPPGTSATDVPTFVCRLFYQKCLALINELTSVFGVVRAYIYTIEFQKRGLPHMHLLVTLNEKLLTSDDVDKFVRAEMPNKDEDPELWYKVIQHMSHGPHTDTSPCWDQEKKICSKKFPKPFIDVTDMTKPGFPIYRRRDNRRECHTFHRKKNVLVDNSMIVPYNPYLLKRFNCHINVEYCASVMSIKYIYKYIHKGHDRARIQVSKDQMRDEIQSYLDTRYVSAMESAWHIMELPMHARSHFVELLPVHLPGQNIITFQEGKEKEALEKRSKKTKLLAYFELNKTDENARGLTYTQIPIHYTWNKSRNVWLPRKNNYKVVARLNIVSPRDIERFHLKLLLREFKGATSYEDILTIEGHKYKTFQEAARAAGLSKSEDHIAEILEDAASVMMPYKLRHFFVYLLISEELDASQMWSRFKERLYEDSNEATALLIIRDLLEKEGMTMEQFGLTNLINETDVLFGEVYKESLTINEHKMIFEQLYSQLNEDQLSIFDKIKKSITGNSSDKLFFVDGPDGTGKTFFYKCLVHYCKQLEKKVATIAWTGIAAILLPYGRTAHKTFNLPLNVVDENATLNWTRKLKQTIGAVEIIIWDEASMIPKHILAMIDRTFRDIYRSDEPFAGRIFIMGGDFRQVLPVVKKGGRRQIFEACLKKSHLWSRFIKTKFTRNMRADKDSVEFAQWLLDIGENKIKTLVIPEDMLCEDLISEFYPSDINIQEMASRTILAARNDEVRKINSTILNRLPGDVIRCLSIDQAGYLSRDEADEEKVNLQYTAEYLSSLTPSGLPPAELNLKVGCIVMLLRNLCISDGLCNGTRMVVQKINRNILMCEILTGDRKGDIVPIPKITVDTRGDLEMPFVLKRTQFPVRLAFSMTINKSQGQTFDKVGLIVTSTETIFTHGQLYVAFSRCRSRGGIRIECNLADKKIKNIVFDEALN